MQNVNSFLGYWLASFFIYPFLLAAIIPIKIYSNAEQDKSKILSYTKNKSGIYMWTNNINKKRYIGSSQNLRKRFSEYFNDNYLIKDNCMQICRALLKYGYSNFSLTIIDYCEPEKCIQREKYYIDLGSEYNTIKDPTLPPMSGRKHLEETKTKISPSPHLGGVWDAKKGNTNAKNNPNSQVIEVTDIKNNTTISYDSIREAARTLNIKHTRIVMYFANNQTKPYKGQYTFKKL